MTRLTRSIRGLLVALAALVLTGGVVLAARSFPLAQTIGTQHAGAVTGRTIPAADPAQHANQKPDADETPEPTESPDADDEADTKAADGAANPDRPHNHGWFVSQAANAETPDGFANHGDYVSSIARGDAGKPDAAASGTDQSVAGKAKGAAAQAAHQH